MAQVIIFAAVFFAIVAFFAAVASLFGNAARSDVENRLDMLTTGNSKKNTMQETVSLVASSLDETKSVAESFLSQFGDVRRFLAQAGVSMTPTQFLLMTVGLGVGGTVVCLATSLPRAFAPLVGVSLAVIPFVIIFMKRKKRIAAFTRLLPDALELISRALRAGHSLAAGFSLVGEEMSEPIRGEFARCYEEQNLGVSLEESLEGMTERVPNLDLRFFATAVILQRQTGGDLAEILDKIGRLIRERFVIWGQIQALTGEGRLSGIVLLALPPLLFVVMYRLNPDYITVLFTDPIGKWMLALAVVLQLVGAIVIKKIINIKV